MSKYVAEFALKPSITLTTYPLNRFTSSSLLDR